MARRFCLMTVGRTGSTSLMEALERFEDIGVPNKNIECIDNELIHPRTLTSNLEKYSALCGRPLLTQQQLMDAFYELNEGYAFAGFKSMTNRHKDYRGIFQRPDLQYITLERRDIASTAASFLLAEIRGSWRRHGEPQPAGFRFDAGRWGKRVESNVYYMFQSHTTLAGLPGAIPLYYEDLCDPDQRSPALDAYFGRPVRMPEPKPPTSGASYVSNWDEMRDFVDRIWADCEDRRARRLAAQGGESAA